MVKLKIFLLFLIILIISITSSSSQGIIIANDKKQEQLFASEDTTKILAFAKEISDNYSKVIIHLGRSYVFRKGNIYYSEVSHNNLKLFCNEMKQKNIQLITWFFDSYGAPAFKELYDEHESIIDENIRILDSLQIPYDGIAIDMEWINKNRNVSNNNNFIKVLKYLRKKAGEKIIWCFASLLNNENINAERGYDTRKILNYADNIIEMLYLQDADFFIFSKHNKPQLNVDRIDQLKKYYKKQGWLLAVSLQPGLLVENENNNGFNLVPDLKDGYESLIDRTKYEERSRNKYADVYEYKVKRNITVKTLDNDDFSFNRRQRIYYFKLIPKKVAAKKDFIWEYFLLNEESKDE